MLFYWFIFNQYCEHFSLSTDHLIQYLTQRLTPFYMQHFYLSIYSSVDPAFMVGIWLQGTEPTYSLFVWVRRLIQWWYLLQLLYWKFDRLKKYHHIVRLWPGQLGRTQASHGFIATDGEGLLLKKNLCKMHWRELFSEPDLPRKDWHQIPLLSTSWRDHRAHNTVPE